MIVFLNKQDILKRKIEEGRKLEKYFPQYAKFNRGEANTEYDRARLFIKQQILDIAANTERTCEIFNPITGISVEEKLPPRDVYIHYTIATETTNIKKIFNNVHEIIIKENIKFIGY